MKSWLLSSKSFLPAGIGIVRIGFGILLLIHGSEIFRAEDMAGYRDWMRDLHLPFPNYIAYLGKGVEFFGGACMVLGIFTRLASLSLFLTFMFISFVLGDGKILTDSQHAFMFGLVALIYFFHGAGAISLSSDR